MSAVLHPCVDIYLPLEVKHLKEGYQLDQMWKLMERTLFVLSLVSAFWETLMR